MHILNCFIVEFVLTIVMFPAGTCDETRQHTSEERIKSAERLIGEQQIDAALELLTDAIALDPKNAALYVARGDAHKEILTYESFESSIADYSRAISLDHNNHVAYRKRGFIRSHRRPPDWVGALADYESSLKIAPNDPDTLCCRGVVLFFTGRPEEAENDFRRAHEIAPEYPVALNNLGFIAEKNGDLDLAISYYTQAIRISPKYSDAYRNRGFALFQKKDYPRAIDDLDKAIELAPKDWGAFIERGDTKAEVGDLQGAMLDYCLALEINEELAGYQGVFKKRAEIYRRLGDHARAEEDLERAKKFEPE